VTPRHAPSTPAIGFVSPPRWVSPTTIEFPAVVATPVIPQQCIPALPDFGYRLDEIAAAGDAVCAAAALLGEAGCTAVGMEGTPFAWAGVRGERAARERVSAMSAAAGVPAAMAGTAIVDALRAVGAARVALCPTYYPTDWRDAWQDFVHGCGFDVTYCRTLADEGVTGPIVGNDDYGWDTGPDRILVAVERAAAHAADAIVVTGAGCRTTPVVERLEASAGRPVIGADSALFWAVARLADLPLRAGSLGALTGAVLP
jgi:maleate cis-trans isomerase